MSSRKVYHPSFLKKHHERGGESGKSPSRKVDPKKNGITKSRISTPKKQISDPVTKTQNHVNICPTTVVLCCGLARPTGMQAPASGSQSDSSMNLPFNRVFSQPSGTLCCSRACLHAVQKAHISQASRVATARFL